MSQPDPLDPLLQTWHPQPSAQPDFARQVRQRLAGDRDQRAAHWWRFPAALPLAASLAIVAGTLAGTSLGDRQKDQTMADVYARSIDPIRLVDHTDHP